MRRVVCRKSVNVRVFCFAAALALFTGAKEARATGLLANVPEASGYTLVYEFPIPTNSPGWGANLTTNPYTVNVSASIPNGSFDRVAYYLELVSASGATQWVYVSATAFTTNATRLGIPRNYVLRNGAYDTSAPSNAVIRSNVSGVTTGDGINTVNLEFWPSDYSSANGYGVPGANASTYDFGDSGGGAGAGHGSMQIHNYGAGQTLFAYNAWGTSQAYSALGIGNQPSGHPDWTFNTANITSFVSRTLQVLVRQLSANNLPATGVTDSSGWMNGQVGAPATNGDAYVFWGDTDCGTEAALWANSAYVGSFTNGLFGVMRQVTGLAGGATNWYTFLSSNSTTLAWATPSARFITATAPSVDNSSGASVSIGQAALRGTLTAGGTSEIYVYWGLSDGGQSTNYDHVVKLTDIPQGPFSTTVSAYPGFSYHYICFASNAAGTAWSPASSAFSVLAANGAFEYANGLRGSVFQTTADTQTPVDLSGSAYAESQTRVPTGSKAGTVLTMAEVSGKNVVLQGLANSWNEFGGSPGDHFVAALSGRFCPTVSGTYTFRWNQDDRGWMFLDAGNDGVFDAGDAVGYWQWACTATRTLTAGQSYPFMFFSHEFGGSDNLAFWYTPPGGVETYVCPSAQAGQWKYPVRAIPAVGLANSLVDSGSLTDHSATLQGSLNGQNLLLDVYVCWGRSDGGSVAGNWETNAYVGRFSNWSGAVSFAVDALASDTTYYYTFFATNEIVGAWATPAQAFLPGEVSVAATDASASEAGDPGSFRVTRPPAATNGALTVFYTLSGTAANGADYATLSGSVTIPVGAVSADIVVAPVADAVWSEGDETVTLTLAAGNYTVGAAHEAAVTISDAGIVADDWSLRLPICFAGYNRAEALTNFPALVTVGPNLSGFSYDQFLSGANGDLRFVDDSLTRELPYEIEKWDASGLSRVWVKVPVLTNNATIWMLWRRSGLTAPAYTSNGSVWTEDFTLVAHHSEAFGGVADSTPFRNNGVQSGLVIQDVPGVISGGDLLDGTDDSLTFGTVGRATNSFTFSAWLQTSVPHQIDAERNSGTDGTSGQKWVFEPEHGGDYNSGSGLSVGTNGISVYEHGNAYLPPLAVYSADIGTNWNHVTVVYTNRAPRIFLNGQLVRTGVASPRVQVNAPYRVGIGSTYGYFGGGIDETRVSSVPRSPGWVWAEYMNAASNDVLATYGSCQPPAILAVANLPASGVSGSAATLNGYLVSTGAAATAVAVYWGTADGGTDAGAWANTNWLAEAAVPGAFSTNLTGLSSGTMYYFRSAASNAFGAVWASATETLLTGEVTLQASDTSATEYPPETGSITVSRGSAYSAPLTVHYTLSGTASNGADMSYLSGEVTIPAGAASADIVVSPLFNRNYQVRATDTVTLTLSTGGYVSGSPNSGTVTITNWQPTLGAVADVPRNFVAASADPIIGSEMITKAGAGNLYVGGSAGNTFSGDIAVDTDGGMLRVGAIPGAASGAGVSLPNMTSANTITVRRGGTFQIEDNVNGSVSSAPNRFGSEGSRPNVALNGGTLTLNGANYNAIVPQNFGTLALGAGFSTVNAVRNSGVPELVFTGVTQAKGSHVNFTSSSGTAMGMSTNAAPHVRFTTPPALVGGGGSIGTKTLSILPGARYGSDWVTHDAVAGVRALTTAEYNIPANNDVNAAGATENVKLTSTSPSTFPPLLADKVINSLNINVGTSASWTPTNKLTLTSGQFISGVQNQQMVINYPSTLTAGSGVSDAMLDVSVFNNNTYIRSYIADNGSGKVALTKNGAGTLILDSSVDNTYSGGTYVNEGRLNTVGTSGRRYLGNGPAIVNAGILDLQQVGATANAVGTDYTAVNGGQIQIATSAYSGEDTFDIGAGCVILGSWSTGQGLNSLDRGFDAPNATPNITLATDAVVAHNTALTAPQNLALNTIRNLGTNCDLYYGIVTDQNNANGSVTVGKGTPFKGVSTDRSDRRWSAGTINVAEGTDEIYLQGLAKPGTTPSYLYVGHWLMAGGPVIAPAGPVTVNLLGNVILEDSEARYGDTSSGKEVTFAVKAGATVQANRTNALGSATGVASLRVDDGGTLQLGVPSALNGDVTVREGGRLIANNAGGMTGSGTVKAEKGSVIELTSVTGLTGSQADDMVDAFLPGQIIRLNVSGFGTPLDTLDSHVGDKSPIYELYSNSYGAANPFVKDTPVMTLNRDETTGQGGMLVNDYAGRTLYGTTDGLLVIGPNGGTIAATSNTILQVDQKFALGANALTIGATDVLDRVLLPKLGTVYLTASLGLNTASAGSSIAVIPGATLMNTGNAIPDQPDVTVNGTFLMNGTETLGSLGGSGWVNLQGNYLTVGRNNNSSTFSGTLTNSSLGATFLKTGSGRMDITSQQSFFSGQLVVNGGTLALSGSGSMTNSGLSAYTLYDGGTLLLDNSNVTVRTRLAGVLPCVTFNGGTFRFVGKDGAAAEERTRCAAFFNSGEAIIDVVNGSGAGSSSEVEFGGFTPGYGTVKFTASNGTLGAAGDNPRVLFDGLSAGLIGGGTVGDAPAYYDTSTGVRAYTLGEGTEFDGTADQTGVDTKYTGLNNHLALDAARSVNSLWIDSPGAGYSVNLGASGANSLTLSSGRLLLTGGDDFTITRSGSSSGALTRSANGTLYFGVGAGRTLTVSVPVANGAGALAKDGAGALVLNAANTFTGALNINEGSVKYGAAGTSDLSGNAVTIRNNGVLDFNGDVDTLGAVTICNGGIINSGSYGALTLSSLTMGGGPAGSASYVDSGSGTNKLGGNVTFSNANDPDTATIAGVLDLNGSARTFTVNNSYAAGAAVDMDITARIIGGAGYGITKNGTGVLRLSNSNAFDGVVSIPNDSGTVIAAHPYALGTPSVGRTFSVLNNDSLAFDGANGNITLSALYTNLFLTSAGDYQIGPVRGTLVNWSGTNTVASPTVTLSGGTYLASLAGKLTLSGDFRGTQDLSVYGAGDMELAGGILTGPKLLNKNGTGTLTLSGTTANIHSNTAVNAGTLLLAKANGSLPVNAIGNGVLTINSGATVRYAASTANPDMIGTNQVNVYANGVLDFNGASDVIGPLNVSAGGSLADTTPVINSAGGGNITVSNGLFIAPAPGFETRINTGSGTLTLGGSNVVFNTSGNGRGRISGNLSLGSTNRYFSINQGLSPDYDLAIDAVISGAPGAGILKDSITYSWGVGTGGFLRFEGANTFDGNVTIMDSSKGTIILANNQALGVPSTARTVTVGYYGSLALDGGITVSDPSDRIGLSLKGYGDSRLAAASGVNVGQSGALFSLSGTNTVPCKITLLDNSQIASTRRMVLTGMLTGNTKGLTVAGPGETAFAGASGMITNVSGVTLISNATLSFENSAAVNKADRIINSIPLTLNSGNIRFAHDGGAASYSETLGAVTVSGGTNSFFASRADEGRTSTLTLSSLTRTVGTVNFVGEGLGETDSRNRIMIAGMADGMIGLWATINGTNLAMYSSTRGVYAGSSVEAGVAALGGWAESVIPNDASVSAVINLAGASDWITLAGVWTNRILEVRQEWANTSTVVRMVEGVTNRTLQASRLSIGAGKASLAIGENANEGTLMALNTGSTLMLENLNASAALSVRSAVQNNGATASGLTKSGPGPVVLSGSNSYSGVTLIDEGVLEFGGSSTQLLAGVIGGGGDLVMSGTGRLTLGTNNTYTGATTIKHGTVVANCNSAFGSTAAGTVIEPGATLDVGGFQVLHALYLAEPFTVSGKGVGDKGAIVNNSTVDQGNAFGKITLAGDTTVGGTARWDLRANTPVLTMNGYDLTKIGANSLMFCTVCVYPNGGDRTGDINISQGYFRFDNWNMLNGSAENTFTIGSGVQLSFYNFQNLYPALWTLALGTNASVLGTAGFGPYSNVWSGPVVLNGRAVLAPVSGASLTFTNTLSGDGSVIKNDAGTVYLNSPGNVYSGTTVVSNGILYAKYPGSLPGYNDGRLTLGGTGFVSLHLSDGTFGFTPDQIHDLYSASGFAVNTAGLSIDTSADDLNIGYDLTKPMALMKSGTNTLTFSATTNIYGGNTLIYGGTLRFASTAGTNSIGKLYAGYSITNGAAVIQEGGYLDCASTVGGAETLVVGSGGLGSYGYYRMNGGTLKTGWLSVPGNNGCNAVYEQTAGDTYVVGSGSWLIMGWVNVNNSAAAINLYGGRMVNPSSNELSMNHNGSRNSYNMISLLGPTAVLDASAGGHSLRLATSGTNMAAVVNLNCGTLIANRVYAGSAMTPSILNLNGGVLKAASSRLDYLMGLSAATVYPGGVVFDTAGADVTVGQSLQAPTGFGLTSVPLRSNGAGYLGAPVVVVTGGSGTGATAVASVDLAEGSPTKGTVTGITVTSPGTGYLPGDKLNVSLVGGSCSVQAMTNDCALGLNDASGGLTKVGLGTLSLAGTNTYGGATTISNGVLRLGVAQALPTGSVINVAGGTLDAGGFTLSNTFINANAGGIINGAVVCSNIVKTGDGQLIVGTRLASDTPIVVEAGSVKLLSVTPGLYEGTLSGAFNTTESFSACSNVSVQLGTRMANTNEKQPAGLWGDYMTVGYSGYIWNRTGTNATWTFAESIDDSTRLKIDGTTVINDGAGWNVPTIGTITLSPGAHAIEVRFGNGPGGAGLVYNTTGSGNGMWWTNRFGFGVDFQGHTATNAPNFVTNFVALTDPGDGSLLSTTPVSGGKSNLLAEATSIVLGEGTLLDLDGYFQALMDLSGSGTVTNGALSISGLIAPGGTNRVGELSVAANTSLSSGTLLVDVGAGGASDRLVVAGSVDLSNMDLEIANPGALDLSKVYTVLTCSGTRTGKFKSITVPDSRWHVLYRADGSVQLIFVNGTVLIFR